MYIHTSIMNILTTEKTQKLVANTSSTQPQKYQSPEFIRQFKHFLIDFKIITTSVSLLIAFQMQSLTTKFVTYVCKHLLKIHKSSSDVISAFISLLLLTIGSFLFIRYIFYKFIFTEDIAKENLVKQAMVETKKDAVKSQVARNSSMVRTIHRDTRLKPDARESRTVRPLSLSEKELFTTYTPVFVA